MEGCHPTPHGCHSTSIEEFRQNGPIQSKSRRSKLTLKGMDRSTAILRAPVKPQILEARRIRWEAKQSVVFLRLWACFTDLTSAEHDQRNPTRWWLPGSLNRCTAVIKRVDQHDRASRKDGGCQALFQRCTRRLLLQQRAKLEFRRRQAATGPEHRPSFPNPRTLCNNR